MKALLDDILEKLTDEFNIPELMAKVEERTPYIVVAFQECERMNFLTCEIKRSLRELDLGLKVQNPLPLHFSYNFEYNLEMTGKHSVYEG